MEDLSGLEPAADDWAVAETMPGGLRSILEEIGRVYAPALLANANAREAGEAQWEATIDGAPWQQQTFPYQVKCLGWIRERYHRLGGKDRARVDAMLEGTGCETLLREGGR